MQPKLPFKDDKDHVYDLIVIGGGSGGISCAAEARKLGLTVALFDYVSPSPGTGKTWGLGGTCVNVGCIPKKLFHIAAQNHEHHQDSSSFGWSGELNSSHNWETLRGNVQSYIKQLNFSYNSKLADLGIDFVNAKAQFKDQNTVEFDFKNLLSGSSSYHAIKADNILIATGGRPRLYPGVPAELSVTSDDIFSLEQDPGTTLVLGGGYIAVECAGFLRGLGKEVYLANRSTFLRTMDNQMSERIVEKLSADGVNLMTQTTVKSVTQLDTGRKHVSLFVDGKEQSLEVDTVLVAIGRDPDPSTLQINQSGVNYDKRSGKIFSGSNIEIERTNVPHIYAVGDIVHDVPELQTVAAKSGKYLAHRISHRKFGSLSEEAILKKYSMDYTFIPTTVFAPSEYSYVGLDEEQAIAQYGTDNVEVYLKEALPLQWSLGPRSTESVLFKVITNLADDERILGMHYVGPSAEEIIGGFAVAMKLGMTKADLDMTLGVHPSISEDFFAVDVTKRSGDAYKKTSC